ncbi:sulfatase-like hydrolase/transferase [Pontiella agarivorans]|uniref:Sulfatase-like hydrolase/transferase n=1 Tax=Pontiella agarivorans TaxID=3038953 RepID=A0ABU5MY38_9BACT|nr:sulfatase-like hydrolase/transferase [Pontiella agarivorans]MDZ8119104.1 sulfatase-like hydrolase/transferase [Pontiella agarivorans]
MKVRYILFLCMVCVFRIRAAEKPNIILLMADDISAREFSFYGSDSCTGGEWAQTPVLDRLAHEGCFLNTVWASTVCMPTRAMLMSGRYAHLTKWWYNGEMGRNEKNGNYAVPESSPLTLGQLAKQAGYRSIWVGKTHVTTGDNHAQFGFDESVFSPGERKVRGTSPEHFQNVKDPSFWNHDSFYWWPEMQLVNHPDEEPWVKTGISDFGPDLEMEYIFDFIERSKEEEQPFFVYHASHLGHNAIDMADPEFELTWPGTPVITWDADTQSYSRAVPKITPNGPVNTVTTTYRKENITPNKLKHHVEYLDYQVWQYITKLEAMGELENTVFFFFSDNGTYGWKASVLRQRGVHVPMVIYAPGQPKRVTGAQDIISDLTDILPTVAEIMGLPLPTQEEYELNGKSLWPYLTQQQTTHRDWIYAYRGNKQMVRGQELMRDGKGNWWDTRTIPPDLDAFPVITDFETLSTKQQREKELIEQALRRFAREDIGGPNSFHATPSIKLSEKQIEKMRKNEASLEASLKASGES